MKNENKLNRRNFLKSSALGADVTSLIANSTREDFAAEIIENAVLPESPSTRRIIPLNNRWLFSEKSTPEALQTNFNDKVSSA